MSSATVAATDNRTRCDAIRHWLTPHRLHCIVLAAYVIVVGTVMCFHEPWFDEAQAWLIARDCSWREMILERPHYEGHPPLWWMMLAAPAKLGVPYEIGLKSINLACATLMIWLLEFKTKLPEPFKVILPFSYFLCYQYGVTSRPYALMVAAMLLVAINWKTRDEKPWREVLSMMLLCLTSSYGLVIAGMFAANWVVRFVRQEHSLIRNRQRFAALLALLAAAVVILIDVMPAKDVYSGNFDISGMTQPAPLWMQICNSWLLLSDNLQERIIGLLYRNQQRTIIDSMRVAAHNLDAQTKELLSAVDAAMADDFSQHAAQWLLQVDDPTQVNELIDRYGKQREYSSMREMLTGLESLHKLRSDVKQQVSSAVNNLHSEEASAAAIAVPERNGDLDPAGWYTLATNVVSTMGVQIEQTMEFNCGGQSGENPNGFVAAYYCQMPDRTQRDVVHILTTHPDWTQTARSPWLVDMVKHELSHRSIMISCGTTQPTIAADRTEAVTNSYSVLFFGADRNRIADQQQGVAEYAMDAHSDQLATAIHDGNCG